MYIDKVHGNEIIKYVQVLQSEPYIYSPRFSAAPVAARTRRWRALVMYICIHVKMDLAGPQGRVERIYIYIYKPSMEMLEYRYI